ncbi:MAG: hypothetical protein ACRCT1_00915, partial [Microcoleaceae cyanobacterium]
RATGAIIYIYRDHHNRMNKITMRRIVEQNSYYLPLFACEGCRRDRVPPSLTVGKSQLWGEV